MSSATQLPAGLEPWGHALSALEPQLVAGMLPLLHAFDDLIRRGDSGRGDDGPLDGYDGLTPRGTPERILMSEWLLADAVPLEFLRRASEKELMHLAPAHVAPEPRGRVVVLVDNGPEQLGAPRLAQLAAVIVLHRRAAARGDGLHLGALGDPADNWMDGDLSRLLGSWVRRRAATSPEPKGVDERLEGLDASDEVWVLAGPQLAAGLTGHRRVLRIVEGTWDARGVQELHVDLDGDRVELALPSAQIAVRALRAAALPMAPDGSRVEGVRDLRGPSFNSQARRLLLRGRGRSELVSVVVSESHRVAGGTRQHQFDGPVLAASVLGKRLVAVVVEGDTVRIRVVGKTLGRLADFAHSLTALDVRQGEDLPEDAHVPALYFAGGDVIFPFRGTWSRISEDECEIGVAMAIAPGKNLDDPRIAVWSERGVHVNWRRVPGSHRAKYAVLGAALFVAVSDDSITWRPFVFGTFVPLPEIVVEEGCEVLALVAEAGEPRLVTLSPAGVIVRLVGAGSTRTLTRWSGGTGVPTVHPSLPLIAVQRADALIEVGDLFTGEVRRVIRSDE